VKKGQKDMTAGGGRQTTQLQRVRNSKRRQRQRQKAIKTIVGCLLLVNFISLLPSLPLCLNEGGGESPTAQLPAIPAVWSFIVFVVLLLLAVLLLLGHKENSIKTQQYRTPSSKLSPQLAPSSPPKYWIGGEYSGLSHKSYSIHMQKGIQRRQRLSARP